MMVEVTQADRDAAAEFCERMGHAHSKPEFPQKIRQGKRDRWFYVKAFARHRIEAFNAGLEAAAKVAEQNAIGFHHARSLGAPESWDIRMSGARDACSSITSAIRNLKIGQQDG